MANTIWGKVGKICIYLLFGLIPVFFLPLTAFPVAENKTTLAVGLVFVAFGALLAETLNTGRLSLPKGRFWLAGIAFLIISGISSALSGAPQLSWWGNLTSPDSFLNFLIYGLAFLLVPVFLREIGDLIKALLFFSISLFLLSVYSLLQFFGIFILPFDFTKAVSFNPIGTVQSLAIFLASGLVMIVALLTSFKLSGVLKGVFSFCAAVLSLILILVNFNYVWLGILFASALVVAWQVMHSRRTTTPPPLLRKEGNENPSLLAKEGGWEGGREEAQGAMLAPKFGLPLVLMVIVAILFFVHPPISQIVQLPAEVRPSFGATLDIARGTLSSGVTSGLFGSGPATFLYEYLIHRSIDLNNTAFWGVRFAQGFSTMPSLLVTIGGLGMGSLLVYLGMFIWAGFKGVATLARPKGNEGTQGESSPSSASSYQVGSSGAEKIALISFVSFLFLLASWFYYPVNFSILLFTFLFAGLVLAALRIGGVVKDFEFSLLQTPQRTFALSLAIIVLIVIVVVGVYWQGQRYIASVYHAFGVQAYDKGQNIDEAMSKVGLAVNLDNSQDKYWRTFAQLLTLRAQEVLNSQDIDTAQLQQRYQVILQSQIQAGQQAVKVNPSDPLNWRQLAAVYEDNVAIVGGADRFAIDNYKKASELNPKNPAEFLSIARAYVRSADRTQAQIARLTQADAKANQDEIGKLQGERADALNKALEALQKSIALKGDYSPAHFLASQVYERQGNRTLAIEKTLETRNLNPLDTGVGYQLGLLYYLDSQTDKAREELERVVSLSETFSNARYFLGLSYDKLGNGDKAIKQFERIYELNPDNEEVKSILKNLRAGKEALAEIVPPAQPPQERIEQPLEQRGGEEEEKLEPTPSSTAEPQEE